MPQVYPFSNSALLDFRLDDPLGVQVREALAVIDTVHYVPEIPEVRIQKLEMDQDDGTSGIFRSVEGLHGLYIPQFIAINQNCPCVKFTLAHEVGHVISQMALGRRNGIDHGSSNTDDPTIIRWARACFQSQYISSLVDLYNAGQIETVDAEGNIQIYRPDYDDLHYLLNPEELWARSYAQYVTVKSRDEVMYRHLEAELRNSNAPDVIRVQWSHEEFKPIEAAFDALFETKGWKQ